MTLRRLLGRLLVPVTVLALATAQVGLAQFGSRRDKDEKGKETQDAKDSKNKEGKSGFGSARKSKKSDDKDDEKDKDKPTEEDRAKQKLAKVISKKLGKRDEGYFVFVTLETRYEKVAAPEGVDPRRVPYQKVEEYEARVLEGKETTAKFLVDYLSEYPPPTREEIRARRRSKVPVGPPDPVRDWRAIRWFPPTQEGNLAAHNLQANAQARYDKQMAAAKKRRK